jgi:DNA-binding FadR family transcriptional regulator
MLLASIHLHEYIPGQRLPSERELGAQLGVNRTAVREAVRWLEHEQYIEVRRGKYGGAFVRQPVPELTLQRLRENLDELRQLLEYRAAVEPVLAAVGAERSTPEAVARLRELHAQECDPELPRAQFRAIDVNLHEIVVGLAHNQMSLTALTEIRVRLAPALDLLGPSADRRQESREGHAHLIGAVAVRDASAAAVAMDRHIEATERAIRAALASRGVKLPLTRPTPAVREGWLEARGHPAGAGG